MANYIAVTWTAGDIITEAKLDNMVSNDQAEDAHPSLILTEIAAPSTPAANKVHLYAKDNAGVSALYFKNDAGTESEIGAATSPKRARVYHDAGQSLNNNTETLLSFNSETFDNDTMHSNVTNNSRLTINTAGIWLLQAQVAFTSNATGYRQAIFRKNTANNFAYVTIAAANGERTNVQITALAELVATDYIELAARQTSGGALNVEGAAGDQYYATNFSAVRLGPTT